MEKKISSKVIKHAVKVIGSYVEQNPRKFPEDTTIHEKNCELGLAHGRCYCTKRGKTRLNYELGVIVSAPKIKQIARQN